VLDAKDERPMRVFFSPVLMALAPLRR